MNDRTVVVTGGTRGIGRAVAERFAVDGATVVVGTRDASAVSETVEALEDLAGTATGLRTDVRDEFDVERLMETASRAGDSGGIDVVVACAGVYHGKPGGTPTPEETYSVFDDHWRTNARGVFATVKEALPHLNEGARVLVPSGRVAREGTAGYGSYAVSKASAEAAVRAFDADTEFVVGCLDPGTVATALSGGTGRDPANVADMFYWAATDADPSLLEADVVDLKTWKSATR